GRVIREVIYRLYRRRADMAPGEHGEARVGVGTVGAAAHRREVVAPLAPDETGILGVAGVERAERAGLGIEHLHAVARPAVDVDRHAEERAVGTPSEIGDVAEGELSAGGEIADDHVGAALARRSVAPEGDVRAVATQRIGLYVIEFSGHARPKIDDFDFVVVGYRRAARTGASTAAAAASTTPAAACRIGRNGVEQPAAVARELRSRGRAHGVLLTA